MDKPSLTPERWAQIEELFHRAVGCGPEYRAALLDQAASTDPELRQEVEALLSNDPGAGTHMRAAIRKGLEAVSFPLTGRTISHYRVLDGLGGGGMGLVYLAEDIRLGRRVALKFLPEDSARDPGSLGRFEREARSASALEHPNICPIYEFGEHDSQPFLAMQLLEGHTLRELISAGGAKRPPLELEHLLDLAIQILNGLDAAHHNGIIHRDIKPDNIFVTGEGQVKILDFGLAKLAYELVAPHDEREGNDRDLHLPAAEVEGEPRPTPHPFLSRTGATMGTAGYMSPEQVRGEKVDVRTDIFSFGLVLYEMATGERAFTGETGPILQQATLTQIPTPVRAVSPTLPTKLEKIINRAIEKDRNARYRTASEVRSDLASLRSAPKKSHARWSVPAAVAMVVLFAGLSLWLVRKQHLSSSGDVRLRQITSNPPQNPIRSGALSPDGKYLAYSDRKGMHVKLIETGQTQSLPEPGELGGKKLEWKILQAWLAGGSHFVVNAHPPGEDSDAWTSEDTSIWIGSVLGEAPRKLRDQAIAYSTSPDGSQIAFGTQRRGDAERELWEISVNDKAEHKLIEAQGDKGVLGATWSPSGDRILYLEEDSAGDVVGLSRDVNGGPSTVIFPQAEMARLFEVVLLHDGRMMYAVPEPGAMSDTCNYWVRRIDWHTGERLDQPRRVSNWTSFCVSGGSPTADDKRSAFLGWASRRSVYLADVDTLGMSIRKPRQFTLDESDNYLLGWTADSKSVIFASSRNGSGAIYRQALNEDTPQLVVRNLGDFDGRVTSDGKWLVGVRKTNDVARKVINQLVRIPLTGGSPEPIFSVSDRVAPLCARSPSAVCALVERTEDRRHMILTTFDPNEGQGSELLRLDLDPQSSGSCDISPDGTQVAVIVAPDGPIQIHSLHGLPTRSIPAVALTKKQFLSWAATGKGLFVTHETKAGSELVYVDLRGNTKTLWTNNAGLHPLGLQSPDGKKLAIQNSVYNGNMWIMENF